MTWKKLGRIFCAQSETELMVTGGRTPVPLLLKNDIYRIFFGAYDHEGRGRIYSLTINISDPQNITSLHTSPLIDMGKTGYYDDNGIIPSCILTKDERIFLYTIGFSLKNKIIFDSAAGLAISKNKGESFEKKTGPILDRSLYDPCFATSPFIMEDNGLYRMWYVSCDHWEKLPDTSFRHYYNIKYKESLDGIHWSDKPQIAIDYASPHEYAISRPTVIKNGENDYQMWYSFREQEHVKTYRIGYAVSENGIDWKRKDEDAGIDVSEKGWDSEMICYPYVFVHKQKKYMLYNGNGYGRSGFGLAVWEE